MLIDGIHVYESIPDCMHRHVTHISEDVQRKLHEMEDFARNHHVPIIRGGAERAYMDILLTARPRHVLEIGAAIGYSGILAMLCGAESLTSIEINPDKADMARSNWDSTPYAEHMRIICGDACDILPNLCGKFDFVFMDAAKGQYPFVFDMIRPLIEHDTVVCADNVLFRGYVIDGRHCPHRMRTIQHRLQKFLGMVSEPEWHTAVFRSGHGISVSARKGTQMADCIENIGD